MHGKDASSLRGFYRALVHCLTVTVSALNALGEDTCGSSLPSKRRRHQSSASVTHSPASTLNFTQLLSDCQSFCSERCCGCW